MLKPRDGWQRKVAAICLVALAGVFLLRSADDVMGQGAKPKSPPAATGKTDLDSDLENAIQLIEKNDFAAFIDLYCPVDMLRRLRQQDLVDRAATVMKSQQRLKPQLLSLLKGLKGQSPKFDKSGGMAILEFDTSGGNVEEFLGELNIPESFDLKVTGLGSDLGRAITDATKLLEAEDISAFVDAVYPASELSRLQAPDSRKALLQQFKETPELAQSILADLKLLAAMKPVVSKEGDVATFSIPGDEQHPKRAIKFQKVDANWRLFDDSPRVVKELSRQTKLKPGSSITIVQMERIGGNWRFIELPMLRLDGQ